MDRRRFLKASGGLGLARAIPVGIPLSLLARRSFAYSPDYSAVDFQAPAVLPQVINIFMYGGPSELAGNLTNIGDIEKNSQNSYVDAFGGGILNYNNNNTSGGQITQHGFWQEAGGAHMEAMLGNGDLTVYRTITKRKNPTRSHRASIFMGHKGALAVENSPGIGTRLASLLHTHQRAVESGSSLADGTPVYDFTDGLLDLPLPFVSFEGESTTFAIDPEMWLPLELKPISMSQNYDNPYSRNSTSDTKDAFFQTLRGKVMEGTGDRFSAAKEAFQQRDTMADLIGGLQDALEKPGPAVSDPDFPYVDADGNLQYPGTRFAQNLKAAVTLAIHNPSTLYITSGTDGLGGWDDHNNGVDRYPGRMNALMEALRVAMRHIRESHYNSNYGPYRRTDNIIINVFGDFGRLVNLNDSLGWDHANTQNLYTFGGSGVRPEGSNALGKVVGTTERVGTSGRNNQYTMPTEGSYEAEPMSIASSVYSYFGARNPEVLTADPEKNPNGDPPLDESQAGEGTLF